MRTWITPPLLPLLPLLRQLSLLLAVAAMTTGCGTPRRYFRPAEKVIAQTSKGFPAAEYQLQVGNERWGELRLWSEGASLRKHEDQDRTALTIGFEIENTSAAPLVLKVDGPKLNLIQGKKAGPLDQALEPEAQAAPGTVRKLQVVFWLPPGLKPSDLNSFRLRWILKGPGDKSYEQFTAFVRDYPYYYGPGYYRPWPYWGYWGYGYWGYGPLCW